MVRGKQLGQPRTHEISLPRVADAERIDKGERFVQQRITKRDLHGPREERTHPDPDDGPERGRPDEGAPSATSPLSMRRAIDRCAELLPTPSASAISPYVVPGWRQRKRRSPTSSGLMASLIGMTLFRNVERQSLNYCTPSAISDGMA